MVARSIRRTSILLTLLALILPTGILAAPPTPTPVPVIDTIDVPFVSQTALKGQKDSKGREYQLGNSTSELLWEKGCGVASVAMVYRLYGVRTDLVDMNAALRDADGFSGAYLVWGEAEPFITAGSPWIEGSRVRNTARPLDEQEAVDAELTAGHPVIAYLGGRHYVVLTGKTASGEYLVNDPWKKDIETGVNITITKSLTGLGFSDITQFVFIYPDRNAPTNGIAVSGAIADEHFAGGGRLGALGQPFSKPGGTTDGGRWQMYEQGAILAVNGGVHTLTDPIWQRYKSDCLSLQYLSYSDSEMPVLDTHGRMPLGWPVTDVYSYPSLGGITVRGDFAEGSILWNEGSSPSDARIVTAQTGVKAEYFANTELTGTPAYTRWEEDVLFNWREGAPVPAVEPDGFSARFTMPLDVSFPGALFNFVVDTDDAVRIEIDGQTVADTWTSGEPGPRFFKALGAGVHRLVVEYREDAGAARLLLGWAPWPTGVVFAAEAQGPFAELPASAPGGQTPAPAQTTPTPQETPVSDLGFNAAAGPLAYDVVLPGEEAQLALRATNTGSTNWMPGRDALVGLADNPDESPVSLALAGAVAPGAEAAWDLELMVTGAPGVRTYRFQMQRDDQPYGAVLTAYVVVLPPALSDMEAQIRAQMEEWKRQGEGAIEDLAQRLMNQIEAELEQQGRHFLERLLQWLQDLIDQLTAAHRGSPPAWT